MFCDYDGTLAPTGVSRTESSVPVPIAKTLGVIHEFIPVAIVTAKDYTFIRRRAPFADAWSCVYGIETVLRNGAKWIEGPLMEISGAVRVVKEMTNPPRIEYKRTSSGEVCGFCAEWTPKTAPKVKAIMANVSRIRGLGLQVLYDSSYPMFDVISRSIDKGVALGVLKKMLGIKEGVMFMGDSNADNPAFDVSDMTIGVLDGRHRSSLQCDYFVDSISLNQFLSALLDNELEFSEDLPYLREREVST